MLFWLTLSSSLFFLAVLWLMWAIAVEFVIRGSISMLLIAFVMENTCLAFLLCCYPKDDEIWQQVSRYNQSRGPQSFPVFSPWHRLHLSFWWTDSKSQDLICELTQLHSMKKKDTLNSMELWLFTSVTNKGVIVSRVKSKMRCIKLCPHMKKSPGTPRANDADSCDFTTSFRV